jgi:hypothetical protein
MAGFKGHILGGVVVAIPLMITLGVIGILFGSFAWFEYPIFLGFCLFGAMWPDTDIGSKSRIITYTIFIILDGVLIYFGLYFEAAIFGLFAMFPAVTKHRGWTHSVFWTLVVGLPLLIPSFIADVDLFLGKYVRVHTYRNLILFGVPYYGSFVVGALSHIVIDKYKLHLKWAKRHQKTPVVDHEI